MTRVLAGFFGAGVALCVLGVVKGLRWTPRQRSAHVRASSLKLRTAVDRWPNLLLAVGAGALVGIVTGWPVVVPMAAAAVWWLPPMLGPDRESARYIERTEALASFAEMLRDTLAAASGLEQAVRTAVSKPPAPISEPLNLLAADMKHGVRLAPALIALADRLADPLGDRICATLIHASTRPARNLPAVLSILASDARSQALAMRQTVASRSQIRTSVRVITGVVTSVLSLLLIADAAYLDPFASALGQLDLLFAGTIFAIAFTWLFRMARPAVPVRLMTQLDALDAGEAHR